MKMIWRLLKTIIFWRQTVREYKELRQLLLERDYLLTEKRAIEGWIEQEAKRKAMRNKKKRLGKKLRK